MQQSKPPLIRSLVACAYSAAVICNHHSRVCHIFWDWTDSLSPEAATGMHRGSFLLFVEQLHAACLWEVPWVTDSNCRWRLKRAREQSKMSPTPFP